MTLIARRIESEMRGLPLEDLLALHELLLAAIHEKDGSEELDPSFRDEIQRRIEEIDTGKVKGDDAFETLEKM